MRRPTERGRASSLAEEGKVDRACSLETDMAPPDRRATPGAYRRIVRKLRDDSRRGP
ncbi:MAG: hypothetical protein LH610_08240 [Sphingomonas bacterium]|nr:hypothetical protein [Sphingomonas bacterium]